ncbi:hypothetical protein [Geodermatophilus sabuli]|uniref:Uncharacterized protein n=1 Tax=Geodermatophilus sabuli TaxID=1564158 RepID=A0A285EC03_9ACTN|nr:hypothetical protein [Geodermatophilus sabuli]MBB3084077.1 hypothetical protein [Geodermatophilus sabuli]SNX96649.1 hypothetical protein SAMN06893097_104364 [Geodermatophilus sabuli]
MPESEQTWIARLVPPEGSSVAELLALPLGLDVWERSAGSLVVAAPESSLAELERRRLARVERLARREQYAARLRTPPDPEQPGSPRPPDAPVS